jgi:hypothetical protein
LEDLHVDHYSNSTTGDNQRSNAIRAHHTGQSVASGSGVSPMASRVLLILQLIGPFQSLNTGQSIDRCRDIKNRRNFPDGLPFRNKASG